MTPTVLTPLSLRSATSTRDPVEPQALHRRGQPRIRVWMAGQIASACLARSTTPGADTTPTDAIVPLSSLTSTPQAAEDFTASAAACPDAPPTTPSPASTAELVTHLHDQFGLTWDQLGKLFGVSRRAVHMWAAGKRMNAHNTELLGALLQLVHAAPGASADERRAWLFAPAPDGMPPVERFLDEHRRPGSPISGSGYTPAGLLGIADD